MIALLISFFLNGAWSCEFAPEVKDVYSLAGSVSLALKDLDLLKSPQLKGVSLFHPISRNEFKGQFLPGGVFLGHHKLQEIGESLIFYDESRELTQILARYPKVKAVQIKTRALTPLEAVKATEKALTPFVKGCDLNLSSKNLEKKLLTLKNVIPKNKTILFFLGEIKSAQRWPTLMMVQDGVVKWMVDEKLITTYPSTLSYVSWSSKIMQEMPLNSLKIGIKDSGNKMISSVKKTDLFTNLTFPGALIPGTGQVEAMIYLFQEAKGL